MERNKEAAKVEEWQKMVQHDKEAARMQEQQDKEHVIVEQRVRKKWTTRMKDQQAVEQKTRDEKNAKMKEQQDAEHMAAEERACNKEAARMKG